MEDKITERKELNLKKIADLKQVLSTSGELCKQQDLCIYATGSYGRLEAGETSDIDLFFLAKNGQKPISRISKTLIDADIISKCRAMGFPEFSGDGEYLEVHDISNIHKELGGRKDDYYNYFTARILLLLESRPVYNEELYYSMLQETVDKYYTDFDKHELEFKPIFLVNDVIRFWRTLCLNYEHNRHIKLGNDSLVKEDIDIKNIKLKFSRKLTCFSFLISVLYADKVLASTDILDIIKNTPMERIQMLADKNIDNKHFSEIISLYSWFLDVFQVEKPQLIEWIKIPANRSEAFQKAELFAKAIFEVMMLSNRSNLQFFVA